MLTHVAVTEPRLVRKRNHGILSLLLDFGQLYAPSAEELLATIGHDTSHVVYELAHEHAAVETHV